MQMTAKCFLLVFFAMFCTVGMVFGAGVIDTVEDLNHDGKHAEALQMLKDNFDAANPELGIVWRMSREIYEMADKMSTKEDKQAKIDKFTTGMDVLKPYLEKVEGTNEDKARVFFWYATNFGARGKVIGIKESLGNIPEMMELAENAIALDPSFASSYFLIAKIDEAVPGAFHGILTPAGDKVRMGIYFNKAIQYEVSMTHLVDTAIAYYDRNWSVDKKKKKFDKAGKDDGSPADLSDREYSLQLLNQAVSYYKGISGPSAREKEKYNEGLKYLNKLK